MIPITEQSSLSTFEAFQHFGPQEQNDMAFVNEFASDEDIERYDLKGIWDKYHPAWKGDSYIGQRPSFTIDRGRNIFFMKIQEMAREAEEAAKQRKLLWWNGAHVIAVTEPAIGSSSLMTDAPFRKIWSLVSLDIPASLDVPEEDVIKVLKEAISAYGHRGIYKQIPNTVTEFNF